ncbi:FHA domain-containing protein [Roseiconus nitratireducens]|uniref:FHA domain-containing protein n=1 Tax=Roseiconus nitratireducens TaxID=2605748 RepID=A0A5M6CGW2_9BACT|nr:FHA domain-containing protein [Roseiconus nitratireducens]
MGIPESSPKDFCLRVISAPRIPFGTSYVLSDKTTIGRYVGSDVLVDELSIARYQCILVWDRAVGRHFVDEGWHRPVFVNGKLIRFEQRVTLEAGDLIGVGLRNWYLYWRRL